MANPQAEKLKALLLAGRKRSFSKGELVQSSDDAQQHLYLISAGFVKRYLIENNGTLSVQYIEGPGDIFPLTFVFSKLLNQRIYRGPEVYYYEAMSKVELYSIDGEMLIESAKKEPLLYKDLLSSAGERFESNIQLLENQGLRTAYHRVAHQLAYLAHRFGKPTPKGLKVNVPLTQQDVADILSTSRETVSLCIVKLREKGLVNTGSAFVIPNLDNLLKEAYS